MEAIREVVKIKNRELNLTLPLDFSSEYVEIIIFPYKKEYVKKEKEEELTDFQDFLLSAPIMTDEDYDFYLEKKQDFNQWK